MSFFPLWLFTPKLYGARASAVDFMSDRRSPDHLSEMQTSEILTSTPSRFQIMLGLPPLEWTSWTPSQFKLYNLFTTPCLPAPPSHTAPSPPPPASSPAAEESPEEREVVALVSECVSYDWVLLNEF